MLECCWNAAERGPYWNSDRFVCLLQHDRAKSELLSVCPTSSTHYRYFSSCFFPRYRFLSSSVSPLPRTSPLQWSKSNSSAIDGLNMTGRVPCQGRQQVEPTPLKMTHDNQVTLWPHSRHTSPPSRWHRQQDVCTTSKAHNLPSRKERCLPRGSELYVGVRALRACA